MDKVTEHTLYAYVKQELKKELTKEQMRAIWDITAGNGMAKGDLPPTQGGCWFCWHGEEAGPLHFSGEWDTFVHKHCVKRVLQKHPGHFEAEMMRELL